MSIYLWNMFDRWCCCPCRDWTHQTPCTLNPGLLRSPDSVMWSVYFTLFYLISTPGSLSTPGRNRIYPGVRALRTFIITFLWGSSLGFFVFYPGVTRCTFLNLFFWWHIFLTIFYLLYWSMSDFRTDDLVFRFYVTLFHANFSMYKVAWSLYFILTLCWLK